MLKGFSRGYSCVFEARGEGNPLKERVMMIKREGRVNSGSEAPGR